MQNQNTNESAKAVNIGSDVWIGDNVRIMEGVTIGSGAVIGCGAVVNKEVEPYSVCVGVPARTIKYRFSREQIERLLQLKWWDEEEKWIMDHAELFDDYFKLVNSVRDKNEV